MLKDKIYVKGSEKMGLLNKFKNNKLFNKIKVGVKAMQSVNKNNDYVGLDEEILYLVKQFRNSKERKMMVEAMRYYEVDNDILYADTDKDKTSNADNRLCHPFFKNMVDEKVQYLLEKDVTLNCEDETYLEKLKKVVDREYLQSILVKLGYQASICGKAWLHPYIKDNELKFMVIPAYECKPIWVDNSHEELKAMIRVYEDVRWNGSSMQSYENVEVWTPEGVTYYTVTDNSLVLDYGRSYENNEPVNHYKEDGVWTSWGRVPFICFKNNWRELNDLKPIKSLIDGYDSSRSEAANYIEDINNIIYVLRGYEGETLSNFISNLKKYRAIKIDDDEGGVDTLNSNADIKAYKEHYESLKADIIELGQGVSKDKDRIGNSPSGIALKFLYSGLDLKGNSLESRFKDGFKELLYFINYFMSKSNLGVYDSKNTKVSLVFNRDMKINESETIDCCNNSKGIISDKTIMQHHPWVNDSEQEEEQIKKEQDEQGTSVNLFNKVQNVKVGSGINEE